MKQKKNKKIKTFSEIVIKSSSPFAREMAITKKGKGGAFEDKRKKIDKKWKEEVKKYYT